jgi:hypothetical protein
MKVTTVINGVYKLVITPENEIEKSILAAIANEPVTISIPERVVLLDTSLSDSVVISPVPGNKKPQIVIEGT